MIKRIVSSLVVGIALIFIAISLFSTITLAVRGKEAQQKVMAAFMSVFENIVRIHTEKTAQVLSRHARNLKTGTIHGILTKFMSLPVTGLDNIREVILSGNYSVLFHRDGPLFLTNSYNKNRNDIDNKAKEVMARGGGMVIFNDSDQSHSPLMIISIQHIPGTDLWHGVYYNLKPVEAVMQEIFMPLIKFRSFSHVIVIAGAVGFFIFIIFSAYITIRKTDLLEKGLLEANSELKRLSSLDGLTGLANRRRFDEYLLQQSAQAGEKKKPLSLLIADIDHFKKYNDRYGHQMGDVCLRRVAGVFTETCRRPEDLPARYGGEEFVAVLPDTDTNGALRVAEGISSEIVRLGIPHDASLSGDCVTLSIGFTTVNPGESLTPGEIIEQADRALYTAKDAGRNRTVYYGKG